MREHQRITFTSTGGRLDATESLSSVERYNPQSNTWHEVAPLSTPKRCVAVAVLNGRLYAVGGSGELNGDHGKY